MALTNKQRRFVDEYLIDLNATQAAARAGYSKRSAEKIGHQLLEKTGVREALTDAMKARSERTLIDADMVLQQWVEIATADPNDLVEYRRGCCPDCWPALQEGGRDAEPNPECSRCGGEGHGRVHVHDSRKLKGAARRLYSGVKLGKDGLQILMRDQDAALLNIARHLGMLKDKVELTGKNGGPVQHQRVAPDLSALTDDELSQLEGLAAKLAAAGDARADQG